MTLIDPRAPPPVKAKGVVHELVAETANRGTAPAM